MPGRDVLLQGGQAQAQGVVRGGLHGEGGRGGGLCVWGGGKKRERALRVVRLCGGALHGRARAQCVRGVRKEGWLAAQGLKGASIRDGSLPW